MYRHIAFSMEDGVASLRLNRPQTLNALNMAMVDEIIAALDAVRDDPAARVLLLSAAGRAFSSGVDMSGGELAPGRSDAGLVLETHFNPLLERLVALRVPIVVAVNGAAAGAGCALALAGDIVIAGRSAYFLQAFVNVGLVPDCGATWLLPRLAGRARALAMMMLGERVPAAEALDWGMIYQLVEDEHLAETALAMARRLGAGPTRAYALVRQGIRACLDSSFTEALAIERVNQAEAGYGSDFVEGVSAFLERRLARFSGR